MPATTESLRALLAPVIATSGWELDDLSLTSAGRRALLRVTVDGDVAIDLDAVAEISRVISTALDDADAFGARAYVLEVSSPGVERPLTEPRHWRRATGRLVDVVPRSGTAGGELPLTGRVVAADDTAVTLDVDGAQRRVEYAQVVRARVQVEFRRPDAPADEDDASSGDGEFDLDETDIDDEDDPDEDDADPDDDDPDVDESEDVGETEDVGEQAPAAATNDHDRKGGTPWTST